MLIEVIVKILEQKHEWVIILLGFLLIFVIVLVDFQTGYKYTFLTFYVLPIAFKTEYEQQIWGDCACLLTNGIICYNASILSNLLTHSDSCSNTARVTLLSRVSPVAW